jgi:hypothetical protein
VKDPTLLALGVFGSVGQVLKNKCGLLQDCRDIDLLMISKNPQNLSDRCAKVLSELSHMKLDVFIIGYEDFTARLVQGDVQLISIIWHSDLARTSYERGDSLGR